VADRMQRIAVAISEIAQGREQVALDFALSGGYRPGRLRRRGNQFAINSSISALALNEAAAIKASAFSAFRCEASLRAPVRCRRPSAMARNRAGKRCAALATSVRS